MDRFYAVYHENIIYTTWGGAKPGACKHLYYPECFNATFGLSTARIPTNYGTTPERSDIEKNGILVLRTSKKVTCNTSAQVTWTFGPPVPESQDRLERFAQKIKDAVKELD